MRKNIKSQLRSLLSTIEDSLINEFNYSYRSSSVFLESKNHSIEASYDTLTGEIEVEVFGSKSWKEYPNLQKLIEDSIDTDKILNEIHLAEVRGNEEYDAVMDNRMALDRAQGYGYGIYW